MRYTTCSQLPIDRPSDANLWTVMQRDYSCIYTAYTPNYNNVLLKEK